MLHAVQDKNRCYVTILGDYPSEWTNRAVYGLSCQCIICPLLCSQSIHNKGRNLADVLPGLTGNLQELKLLPGASGRARSNRLGQWPNAVL